MKIKQTNQISALRRQKSKKPRTRDPKKILAALKSLLKEESKGGCSLRLHQAQEEAAHIDWKKLTAAIQMLREAINPFRGVKIRKAGQIRSSTQKLSARVGTTRRLKTIRDRSVTDKK